MGTMGTDDITRSQTARRARLLRLREHYITLDLTRGEEVFRSESVIRFDCTRPGASSHADLIAKRVLQITLNGEPLDPAVSYDGSRVTLPALRASNELRVVADCAYTRTGTGMHRSTDPADGGVHVYGKFTPAYARTAFACFEQPDLKTPFIITVIAPPQWAVLSNQPPSPGGQPAATAEGGNHPAATHSFLATPPLPTFATTVVAGDFHVSRSTHVMPGGREIPLELACRASLAGQVNATAVFDVTAAGLDFYADLLGVDYPFSKYGHAFVPEFSAGATEDPGCVLMSESFLPVPGKTAADAEMRTMVILHEMAHMWFGNLVTMQWWDDLWLSESFAEFCGHDASVRLGLFPNAWATFSVGRKAWGIAQDRLPSTHPVAADPATLSEAIANFDGISYAKGAAVLRQLSAYVGEDAFFAGIGDYLRAHAHGNARLPDLLSAVAGRADPGKEVASWSAAWLQTAGPNTLRPLLSADPAGTGTSFAVLQEAPLAHPVLRPHRISVGLYTLADNGALVRTGGAEATVTGARTEVPALTGRPRPDLVLLNDDDRGYVAIRFDSRSLRTALSFAGQVTDPVARAVIWDALIDMTQQAELSVPAFTGAVARGVEHESSEAVLQALLGRTETMIARLAAPPAAAACKRMLADLAARQLPAAAAGSGHQRAWALLLARTATSASQLDLAAALVGGTRLPAGLEPGDELQWALLRRLAATGRAGDTEIDAMLARDRTGTGQREAAACRAAIPDAAHKDAAWRLLTGGTLGAPSAALVARALLLPEHAGLLADFPDRYADCLPRIWATSAGTIRVLLGEILFPYPVITPELLARLDAMTDAAADSGLVRLLREQRDIAERALRSRAL
jgi:aminopeptidase N